MEIAKLFQRNGQRSWDVKASSSCIMSDWIESVVGDKDLGLGDLLMSLRDCVFLVRFPMAHTVCQVFADDVVLCKKLIDVFQGKPFGFREEKIDDWNPSG